MATRRTPAAAKVGYGVAAYNQDDSDVLFNTKGLACLLSRQGRVAKKKELCLICLEDIDSELMFYVDRCGHRFCIDCMKKHMRVKLVDGTIPSCPHYRCKSQLSINSCGELLTSKQILMWIQRTKEYSIPSTERVYCPYDGCSYVMSKTELSRRGSSANVNSSGLRRCLKCGRNFCVHCKVPWHSNRSCDREQDDGDAKLKYLANLNGWRQCPKCQHMVGRSYGCRHITCRCGTAFCYKCGSEWNSGLHLHGEWNQNESMVAFIVLIIFVSSVLVPVLYYRIR